MSNDNWATPIDLFLRLDDIYHFGLDPASNYENHKCINFFTEVENGLSRSWAGYGNVFLNPPYGRNIHKWIEKAYLEFLSGTNIVLLLPASTDTKWFHDICLKFKVEFLKGRLSFNGYGRAPFPSMIVYMVH